MILISKGIYRNHAGNVVKPNTPSRCEKESPGDQKPGTRCLDREKSFVPPITFDIDDWTIVESDEDKGHIHCETANKKNNLSRRSKTHVNTEQEINQRNP